MRPVTGSLGSTSMDSTILAVRSSLATSLKLAIFGSSRRSLPTRCADRASRTPTLLRGPLPSEAKRAQLRRFTRRTPKNGLFAGASAWRTTM